MRGKDASKKRNRNQALDQKAQKKQKSEKGYIESIYNLEEYFGEEHLEQIHQIIMDRRIQSEKTLLDLALDPKEITFMKKWYR